MTLPNGEVFKFRRLRRETKKTFALAQLPDAYRLLPTQGRGNVHRISEMRSHAELLVKYHNPADLCAELRGWTPEKQMDFLGSAEWESLCLAWLILKHEFVPAGLMVGRTLPDYDIVGRNWGTGRRILAQCKKNAGPVRIPDEFGAPDADAYYFAYGGITGKPPRGTEVVDRAAALDWVKESKWLKLCLGGSGPEAAP